MPALREHAKDGPIGRITQKQLEYLAELVERHARKLNNPLLRLLYRDRNRALEATMLAAVLSRVRGVPERLPDQFEVLVASAMRDAR